MTDIRVLLDIPWASALPWMTAAPLACMAGTMAFNLSRTPRLEKAPEAPRSRKVSVLVPARNEEGNLGVLLPLLARQGWSGLEILVLDDESSDGTARVAAGMGPAVRVIPGKPLPPGWLGKSWACAQLAREASGEVLLFCDADVRPEPGAVAATLALMDRHEAEALTCLPRQILGSWPERAAVPLVMHLPVLSLLPLPLVHRRPDPALSLGVGQWFAFTRETYDAIGGHAAVRQELAEDMALARKVKEAGFTLAAALSTRILSVRMYRGFPEVWSGFRKNLVCLTGAGWARPCAVLAFHLAVFVVPWIMAPMAALGWVSPAWALPAVLLAGLRLGVAVLFREPAAAWLWHAPGSLLVAVLAIRSWSGYRNRSLDWKGRVLTAAFPDRRAHKIPRNTAPEAAWSAWKE